MSCRADRGGIDQQIEQVPAGGIDVVSIVLIACLIICVGAFIIGVIDVL